MGQQLALTEMAYVITRMFQRYSGVELRGDVPDARLAGWVRTDIGPTLPERFTTSRLQLKHEISLQPSSPINMAFLS